MDEQHPKPDPAVVRRAVIDVGTNSVKLLVADVDGGSFTTVVERNVQTRLGRGFYEAHRLQPKAIEDTVQVIAEFVREARRWETETPRIVATSAAREAVNQNELLSAIRDRCGLAAEVIKGEQEADWIYQGVASDPRFGGHPLLILDVGGGSSEFMVGDKSGLRFRNSFRLGAVRLLERSDPADPPTPLDLEACRNWTRTFLCDQVKPELVPVLARMKPEATRFIGTGGAANILAGIAGSLVKHDVPAIEATALSREMVRDQVMRLWSLPLAGRERIVGLPPDRADIILTGAVIFEMAMEAFDFQTLRVSTRGLRHAAILAGTR